MKRHLIGALVLLAACSSGTESRRVSGPFFPAIDTTRTLAHAGLRDRVEVLYDDQGVPHIYATNAYDAMFVQGYASARDRFFQMEVIRKASSGRISELFGVLSHDDTLEADLEMRRINMTARGTMIFDELLGALNAAEQARILAYTRGINAWLADAKAGRNGAQVPFEYEKNPFIKSQGLDFKDTAAWTVADSFAIGRFQQWNLSGSLGDELGAGEKRAFIPATVYTETFRFEPADRTVSIDDFFNQEPAFTGLGSFTALTHLGALMPAERAAFAGQVRRTLAAMKWRGRSYAADEIPGSNNWVVGPKLTKGAAMLANDPHLSLVNPPLFYNTHLNTARFGGGDWDAVGVTFPGIPGLLIGHNQHLAWGVTTLGYDVMDLYREKLSGGDVAFAGKRVPVAYTKQTFRFGTGSDAKVETVDMPYVPHHGAVVSGEGALKGAKEDLITMKWTGREQTADYRAFFDLLAAKNVDDFFAAVHFFDVGAQSFVAADVDGNIGFFGHALLPKREWDLETYTPDAPLPGEGGFEWKGYYEDGKLVQAKNPAKGYIATANNDIVGTNLDNDPFNDPVYYWYWQDLGFRIGRISQLIEASAPVSLADMEAIQNDTYSLEAERLVPRMLALMNGVTVPADARAALDYLRAWRYGTPTGIKGEFRTDEPTADEVAQSIAVSIFYRWENILRGRILEDDMARYGTGGPGGQGSTVFLVYALANTDTAVATAHWFDDVGTLAVVESPADLLLVTLQETLADLATEDRFGTADMSQWQWGKLHKVEGEDVVGLITGTSRRSNGPTANDGSQYTVDVGGYDGDFVQHSGSQIRFVAEMKKGAIVSRSMIPGGQADDLESKHYADQWANWVTNKRLPYRFYDKDVEANVEAKWVFLPE
jgi:penicillin amidase